MTVMSADYADVFRDPKAVTKYSEETYASGSYSSLVSQRQREWLRGFVGEAFESPPVHHDFACGTGRAMRMLDGMARRSHGYDTSEAMLAKAREVGVPGQLHLIEESGELPTSSTRPALVTMFRLLLNASAPVRDRAMEFAGQMLPDRDAGLLVCENHGNTRSVRRLRAVLRRHDTASWFAELSHAEVLELFDRHGFEMVTRQGFTMVTRGCYTHRPLSWIAPTLDDFIARRSWSAAVATDVLYVARRKARA